MIRTILVLFQILFLLPPGYAQTDKFVIPLKGVPGRDFFITEYVDQDTTDGVRDAFCGSMTYNGHTGTDLTLRSFKTMDSGVYVYAAMDGRVYEVHDGDYDRSKEWKGGGLGNHVKMIHKNELCTYYGHMMTNSILVKVGDSVKAGQVIGKVGSSGKSKGPHLHFEVRERHGKLLDPFSGACQSNPSLWILQPEYDERVYAIESGFVPYKPGWDDIKERRIVRDTFYADEDRMITYWVLVHGLREGKKTNTKWIDPNGHVYYDHRFAWNGNYCFNYAWTNIKMPDLGGKWTVKFFVDGKLVNSQQFTVMETRR